MLLTSGCQTPVFLKFSRKGTRTRSYCQESVQMIGEMWFIFYVNAGCSFYFEVFLSVFTINTEQYPTTPYLSPAGTSPELA